MILNRHAFGGLGAHVRLSEDVKVQSVNLLTNDVVILTKDASGETTHTHGNKIFSRERVRQAVLDAVKSMEVHSKSWRLADYPDLAAWVGDDYHPAEQPPVLEPVVEAEAAPPAEEADPVLPEPSDEVPPAEEVAVSP